MSSSDALTPRRQASWLSACRAHDWAFAWGVLLPVAAYALPQKALRIASLRTRPSLGRIASLFVSDLAIEAAGLLAAVALLTWFARAPLHLALRIGLSLLASLYLGVLLAAHGFFMSTGTALDWPMLYFSFTHLADTAKVIASASSPGRVGFFSAALAGVWLVPWLLARRFEARGVASVRASDRAIFGLIFAAAALGMFTLSTDWDRGGGELVRDPWANVVLTLQVDAALSDGAFAQRALDWPRGPRRIEPRADRAQKPKNVVILLLESMGAWATSLYGGPYATTPELAALAAKSVLVERMYAVVPHTSKALTAVLCGIDPRPGVGATEALKDAIPGKCLPALLSSQGYDTMFMQAATREFESRSALVKNLGFARFLSGDEMNAKGLKAANYFGYEDRILLEPVRSFLEARKTAPEPFLLTVLTNTPHHDYRAPPFRERETFVRDPVKNRFLNGVRYDDFVVADILRAITDAGLAENTLVVILGDHGEGFGEHGRYAHDDVIYEEGLRVPFVLHDPTSSRAPTRWPGVYSEIDVTPTVLDVLGFTPREGSYRGASIFTDKGPRVAYAACYNEGKCVARIDGHRKLIHHFGRTPDELFDLEVDPLERNNLLAKTRLDVAREQSDVLDWYGTVRALYRTAQQRGIEQFVSRTPPARIAHPQHFVFGGAVELLGWEASKDVLEPGGWVNVTYSFHVLTALPDDYKLFVHGYDGMRRSVWDHVPVDRRYPEQRWQAGEYISDVHRIWVPPTWRSDAVVLRLGFWSKRSGKRLAVVPAAPGDAPIVLELPVRRRH